MSIPVFPKLPGISYESSKTPEFATVIQRAVSGREQRGAFRSAPLWIFTLKIQWLRPGQPTNEYETLQGFILGRQGSFGAFLYLDPTDSVCVGMPFGVGDGAQTTFQLTRSFGLHGSFGFAEPVENIKAVSAIKIGGTLKSTPSDYSISPTGIVAFTTPPPNEAVITWSGEFYFRCRFAEDTGNFTRVMPDLWRLEELQFIGAPGNKI